MIQAYLIVAFVSFLAGVILSRLYWPKGDLTTEECVAYLKDRGYSVHLRVV